MRERVEIEARLFVFTYLGGLVHTGRWHETGDREQMLEELLATYPLERWHEMLLITKDQVETWIGEALAIIVPSDGDSKDRPQ
jgi:hypothetical protein